MHEKKGEWKDTLQLSHEKTLRIAELEAKNKELLRAITLKNRAMKKLEDKYMKLKKDKQVDYLKDLITRLEKKGRKYEVQIK